MQILKKIKNNIFIWDINKGILILMSCFFIFGCGQKKKETLAGPHESVKSIGIKYSCPMHPSVIESLPGICPVCKMDLVKLDASLQAKGKAIEVSIDELIRTGRDVSISSVMVIKPERKSVRDDFKAPGYITYDTRMYTNVSARASGRIEKMYVKYAFQDIKKGDKLFDIYSPEILSAQRDLIYLLNHNYTLDELKKTAGLIEDARARLVNLGMSREEVDKVERSKKGFDLITMYSPSEGHLHEMQMKGSLSTDGMYNPSQVQNPRLSLKEGMYVNKGQNVLNLVYPHTVWVELNIFPEDYTKIHLKQDVEISLNDRKDTIFKGKIDFIEPIYIRNIKSLNARVYLDNFKHILKVGQLVSAVIRSEEREGLWIPTSSVISLGNRSIVWLEKKEGVFVPRTVITGSISASMIELKSGIDENEKIALNAAYITDSESFIK
jgi:Cu(I)/Ag(I) efflux system membrane fusion protein